MTGCLFGNDDFRQDKLEAQDPWIIVPVLGAIGMNNAGRRNLKVKLKHVLNHFVTQTRVEPFFSTAMRHIWRMKISPAIIS